MASFPLTCRLIFVFFFVRSFAQPIAGHIQKENTEVIAPETNKFCLFHFCIFVGPIAVDQRVHARVFKHYQSE